MTNIAALPPGTNQPALAGGKEDPKKIKDAAVQFEALMVTTLLRAAKEGGQGGWMGAGEEDQSLSPAVGMAEEQLAAAIARQGGMGLSKMILEQLQAQEAANAAPGAVPGQQSPGTEPAGDARKAGS